MPPYPSDAPIATTFSFPADRQLGTDLTGASRVVNRQMLRDRVVEFQLGVVFWLETEHSTCIL